MPLTTCLSSAKLSNLIVGSSQMSSIHMLNLLPNLNMFILNVERLLVVFLELAFSVCEKCWCDTNTDWLLWGHDIDRQ